MSTTYALCNLLIRVGLTTGLQEKLDTFYGVGRLNTEEYTELTAKMAEN